jgi:hypothetical protein
VADTVNLFGKPVKKAYVIGGGVIAGALFIYEYRKQQAAKSATAATAAAAPSVNPAGDQYPPDGTTGNPSDPYSTDPATGMTYGDEAGAGYTGNGAGNLGGYYGSGALYGGGTGYEQPGSFTSNAYWTQYAEQMMGSSGSDAISAALGAYVAGAALSTTQVSIVEQAVAIAGYPPVAGSGGYPPSIRSGASGSGSTGSTAPAGPLTFAVPDGMGKWMNATFPSQAAVTAFYTSLGMGPHGVYSGHYPNGLTNAQITQAVQAAGGKITSPTGYVLPT